MDIERKKNILFLASAESHECIEAQRDSEGIMVDKKVYLSFL